MDALTNTTAAPPAPLPPIPRLTRRQENYARCVAFGMSYADAFREAGCVASNANSRGAQIACLNRTPAVRSRIAELRERNDAAIESTFAERASWLRLVALADPEELTRVVRTPCDLCWTDEEMARALAAHFAPNPFNPDEPRPALPDTDKPRADCRHCQGDGRTRVVVTPTDELSPAGRALFKSASQDKDGVIKIQTHDQAAALDMLNRMHSSYVTRSLNLNANVAVHAARDASPEDAMRLFEAFGS